jgi:hypothetical protein
MSTACNHVVANADKEFDANGIFLCFTCHKCRKARLGVYKASVLDEEQQMFVFGRVLVEVDG